MSVWYLIYFSYLFQDLTEILENERKNAINSQQQDLCYNIFVKFDILLCLQLKNKTSEIDNLYQYNLNTIWTVVYAKQ